MVDIYPPMALVCLGTELPAWNFQIRGKFTRSQQEKKKCRAPKEAVRHAEFSLAFTETAGFKASARMTNGDCYR